MTCGFVDNGASSTFGAGTRFDGGTGTGTSDGRRDGAGGNGMPEAQMEAKPCPKPPTPGPRKATLDRNINDASTAAVGQNRGTIFNLFAQSLRVTTDQNYKANPKYRGSAPFGNFNFGATFQARGFSLEETLGFSNAFQILTTGKSDPIEDVNDVRNGYNYAALGCGVSK